MRKQKTFLSGLLVASMLSVTSWMPAHAAMVTTEQMVSVQTEQTRDAQLAQVQGFLARADVKQQLEALGVASELADQRVAALSDAELQQLSKTIGDQPAGGDVIVVLGVIFVVLIVLELLGVTHVFSRF
jgi:hypothetical protein